MSKKITADQFADETSIVPDVVAKRIVAEAAALVRRHSLRAHHEVSFYDTFQSGSGIFRNQEDPVVFLVDHTLAVYSNNARLKKQLRGDLGLGYLESYMRHWISAEMIKRTRSPLVRAWLTELNQFANGEPFNG